MSYGEVKKITIIGAGLVGSTIAYTLIMNGLISEIVVIDINKEKSEGEVMDLNHGVPFVPPVKILAGEYRDCQNSDIIILTAGTSQKPGESRLSLVHNNTAIFKDILREILKFNQDCILLVVTNPVDILTYITYKLTGFPKNKVIGSGTVLDTARFRYLLGNHVGIDARNIHAYILGEHGDTEVPAWSISHIAGIPMDQYCKTCNQCNHLSRQLLYEDVRNAAYEIIQKKGSTYYAIALGVNRIVEAILRDENSILTVSSLLEGQYGLTDVALSLPTIVNKSGVERILDFSLSDNEVTALINSGNALKETIKNLVL